MQELFYAGFVKEALCPCADAVEVGFDLLGGCRAVMEVMRRVETRNQHAAGLDAAPQFGFDLQGFVP